MKAMLRQLFVILFWWRDFGRFNSTINRDGLALRDDAVAGQHVEGRDPARLAFVMFYKRLEGGHEFFGRNSRQRLAPSDNQAAQLERSRRFAITQKTRLQDDIFDGLEALGSNGRKAGRLFSFCRLHAYQ